MSRRHQREIERRLRRMPAELPAAEPPAALLERLRAEIPGDLGQRLRAGAETEDGEDGGRSGMAPVVPFPSRRWLAAAAILVMLVGGSLLAWRLWPSVAPLDRSRIDGAAAPAAGEEVAAQDAGSGEAPRVAESAGAEDELREEEVVELPTHAPRPEAQAERLGERKEAAGEERTGRSGAERAGEEVEPAGSFADEIQVVGKEAEIDMTPSYSATYTGTRPAAADVDAPELGPPSVPPPVDKSRRRQRARQVPPPPPPPAPPVAEPEGALMIVSEPVEEIEQNREAKAVRAPEPPPVNPVVTAMNDRLSTFGLDVDTGSYTVLRAHLEAGEVPPPAAMRVEEVVNAQPFTDPFAAAPARPGEVFRLLADGAPSPFAPGPQHRLLRFRIATPDLAAAARKPVVLTLVVDVSGSMAGEKLELVKRGLGTLLDALRPDDRVALVVFSDEARLAAPHGEPSALARAAGELATEGGTNAEAGLRLGYRVARQAFVAAAANRVMLLSDGVANVGATGPRAILRRVAEEAAEGIELTTVGVGMGEFNDEMLETLADRGDGRYAYVDDRREIDRLFSGELDGTLHTVAEEARAQVQFDPRVVESWRQLGYENRAIADHEFRYDSVDAGEIGPGHSVTALYEVKLRGTPPPGRPLALLALRWREPAAADGTPGRYHELEQRLLPEDLSPTWAAAAPDLRLAAVAAELAEQLRRSPHADSSPTTLLTEARRLAPQAPELVALAHKWSDLSPSPQP